MDAAKKVLIVHASAGHGHAKAAAAVAEALREKGTAVDVRDALDLVGKRFGRFYKGSYLSMIQSAQPLWGLSYYTMDAGFLGPLVRPLRRGVNAWLARGVTDFLLAEKPSSLVCTHFMSVEIAGTLKARGLLSSKLVAVVTDYLAHAFWIHRAIDEYAVGCDRTREDLLRRGVPAGRIRVTGLPTSRAFRSPADPESARLKLGFSADRPTVLVTSGGAGVGPIEEMVRGLAADAAKDQVIVVCGTNRALFERISALTKDRPLLRAFAFVDNMHELMAAADLVVGKAGGLTLAESFCLGLPVIMVRPVPGQEGRNALVASAAGAGVTTRTASETVRIARSILGNRPRLSEMKEAARRLGRPDAAGAIAEMALS